MSKAGITLLYKLLKYDPEDRITARLALRSEWCQAYKLHKKGQKGTEDLSCRMITQLIQSFVKHHVILGWTSIHLVFLKHIRHFPKTKNSKLKIKILFQSISSIRKSKIFESKFKRSIILPLLVENNHFLSHHSIIQNYRRLKRGNFQSLVIIANKQAINSQQIKTRIHNLV